MKKYRLICDKDCYNDNYDLLFIELHKLKLKNFNVRTKPLKDADIWRLADNHSAPDGVYFIQGIQYYYKTAFEYLKKATFEAIIEEVDD